MEEPEYYDISHVKGISTHIEIDNGIVESATNSFSDTAVMRVLGKRGWGVVTIENFTGRSEKEIKEYIALAMKYAKATEEEVVLADCTSGILPVPKPSENPTEVSLEEKCSLLMDIERAARIDSIVNTRANYTEGNGTVHFTDSSGHEYKYSLCRSGYSVSAVAKKGSVMQAGRESEHTILGFNLRHKENKGLEAAERAVKLLDAKPAKGGIMDAVLDQELAGVFAHEAVGHASEGDLVKEGISVLKGMNGKKIGADIVNVVDDPTLHEFGFMPVDSEGVLPVRTEIIKKGVLNSYLHNRQTLAAVGFGDAGHARSQPGDVPVVRMSNTFIENGDSSYDEIVSECKNGILLKGSRGGQVDPGRGVFQFNAEYGYVIKNGELSGMVRDVSLSGDILKTLHNITLCAKDRKMNPGYCGKSGQNVPVTDGSPHLLLREAIIGGQGQ
ncbi:TldD protein [Methanomicrobium sp. W14]|uniref:TldD/PmbA family protein n=1 Tax=Methanomicrobium sp. W14 TaxID=2817839 RepID=UPI001AE9CDBD|nr:TldD/PmbA family protein [Methanomicrobium sp. W14]MBP2133604.1 TldD protein [Methanomicrobium sp. W14]